MILMAKVVASIKLFPEDIIANEDEMKEAIKKALPDNSTLYRIDDEPIAFGLIALIAHIVIPESSGELEKVEEALRKVKGISEVETLLVRRI